jgi:hypothetical protein
MNRNKSNRGEGERKEGQPGIRGGCHRLWLGGYSFELFCLQLHSDSPHPPLYSGNGRWRYL